MTEKKYPHILLTSVSTNGNYFGAYKENDSESKKGYVLFLTTSPDEKDWCECMGHVHGKRCYHLKNADILSKKLVLESPNPALSSKIDAKKKLFDIGAALEKANKERENPQN